MWYNGTYSCGHDGRVNVIGKTNERRWKIEQHFAGICEECLKKKFQQENAKAIEKSSEYGFPELSGTEKQVSWANKIRIDLYELCKREKADIDDIILNEITAKFWIDNRNNFKIAVFHDFIDSYYAKEKEKQMENDIISMNIAKPEEIRHDGVIEIIERNDTIYLKYDKDKEFMDLAKSLKYHWNGSSWCRELNETTGTFESRAAEAGHLYLEHGFRICIHDKITLNKAISGQYIPECTRWVYSRKDSSLLAINFERNDKLYQKAMKLKGAGWSSPSVVIDVSHYQLIEKFAEENGFKFTKSAKEKIEKYKKTMYIGE